MRQFMANAKTLLWEFVELGFVTILAIMLIYLLLRKGSRVFVVSVADNVTKFASGVPTQSLIGLALVLAVILPDYEPPEPHALAKTSEQFRVAILVTFA